MYLLRTSMFQCERNNSIFNIKYHLCTNDFTGYLQNFKESRNLNESNQNNKKKIQYIQNMFDHYLY